MPDDMKPMDEADDTTEESNYSFAAESAKPAIEDGLWKLHDAFCAVTHRIIDDAVPAASEMHSKNVDEYAAALKKLLTESGGDTEALGYKPGEY